MVTNKAINEIRFLGASMISNARSGHTGMTLGAAPLVCELYKNHVNINPEELYYNRDRVIFSSGHGSALYYSVLFACGFKINKDELYSFRNINSRLTGHPELNPSIGIESTSGPLGQGVANAVGIAMAEKHLAAKFNQKDFDIVNHHTYCILGEGCLMEGIAYEAMSLAGQLKLNKLIFLYDANLVTLDGKSDISFNEDITLRLKSQNINVIKVRKCNDTVAINKAINRAKKSINKPSLIIVPSIIGYGTDKQGTNAIHGKALDEKELNELKQFLQVSNDFNLSDEVKNEMNLIKKGNCIVKNYNDLLIKYKKIYPKLYKDFINATTQQYKLSQKDLLNFVGDNLSGRDAGHKILNLLSKKVDLFGGSADVFASTKAFLDDKGIFSNENPGGSNIYFGVREHAMSGICGGIALHGGVIPFCSTFLVFSDYMRASIRLNAIQNLNMIYVFTHDSIEVGEDGPTHQPVEQIASLELIPNVKIYRPATDSEIATSYYEAIINGGVNIICLSKSSLISKKFDENNIFKGAYVIHGDDKSDITILSSGTEVNTAIESAKKLEKENISVKVVSVYCLKEFLTAPLDYRLKTINSKSGKVLGFEAVSSSRFKTITPFAIGVDEFGKSGKKKDVKSLFGINEVTLMNFVKNVLEFKDK